MQIEITAEEDLNNLETSWFDFQTNIRKSFRRKLLEWLFQIHLKYRLNPSTLFLTVSLFDRYMGKQLVDRKSLQLVGSACLWMASKYHDIHPLHAPSLSDLAAGSFSELDMVKTEQKICLALDFNLTVPCPLFFLERFLVELRQDHNVKPMRKCCTYVLEHIIMDQNLVGFKASLKASIALYFTLLVFKKKFTKDWENFCTYKATDLHAHVKSLYRRILHLDAEDRVSKKHSKISRLIGSAKIRKLLQ